MVVLTMYLKSTMKFNQQKIKYTWTIEKQKSYTAQMKWLQKKNWKVWAYEKQVIIYYVLSVTTVEWPSDITQS